LAGWAFLVLFALRAIASDESTRLINSFAIGFEDQQILAPLQPVDPNFRMVSEILSSKRLQFVMDAAIKKATHVAKVVD
jgi:hypothetical protein